MAIINAGGSGTTNGTTVSDTIYGTEGTDNIYGGGGDDIIFGNGGSDGVRGDTGSDELYGGAGNDFIDGGVGVDLMVGSVGDDTYVVDSLGDIVVELAGEGIDTVVSTINWTLGDNFEMMRLAGTAAIDGTGNALDNGIKGNSGANRLYGLTGNDSLEGLDGDDLLVGGVGDDWHRGGTGADTFAFARTDIAAIDGSDRIVDVNFGEGDRITLAGYGPNGGDWAAASYFDLWLLADNFPNEVMVTSNDRGLAVVTIVTGGRTQVITLTDASGLSSYQLYLDACPVPVPGADSATTGENTPVTVEVLGNDHLNVVTLRIIDADAPAGQGRVTIDGTSLAFDPGTDFDYLPAGQSTVVLLTYEVVTVAGKTGTGTVSITIQGVNDTAVIGGVATGSVTEDTHLISTGKLTVTDVDTGEASFRPATVTGSYGSLAITADGTWTYTLNNSAANVQALKTGDTRTDTLVVRSLDGTTKSIAITVRGTNDGAVIGGCDTGIVSEDCDWFASGKLTISNPDGKAEFDGGIYAGKYGYVALSDNGGWLYVLNPFDNDLDTLNDGQRAIDSVVIKAADGTTHTISITVKGENECPTNPRAFTGTGDNNDLDGFKTSAVSFSSLSNSALGNANKAYGTAGHDNFDGKAGADTLYGWAGNDCLSGGSGNDVLHGGTGTDTLYGGLDHDTLFGGSGSDTVFGDAGNDLLVGGFGADRLTGGSGNDVFRFLDTRDTGDFITDFSRGSDKIDLSMFKANGANYDFDAPVNASKFAVGRDLIWFYDGNNTVILGNTDADPNTAEFMLTLAGRVTLGSSDFLL